MRQGGFHQGGKMAQSTWNTEIPIGLFLCFGLLLNLWQQIFKFSYLQIVFLGFYNFGYVGVLHFL